MVFSLATTRCKFDSALGLELGMLGEHLTAKHSGLPSLVLEMISKLY